MTLEQQIAKIAQIINNAHNPQAMQDIIFAYALVLAEKEQTPTTFRDFQE